MSRLRIAVTQSGISRDVTRNGEAVRSAMRLAARNDARLVQFPEGMLSGYPKEQVRDWAQVDWVQLEHELDLIRLLARELGIWVVLGSAHRLTAPNRPHNSLYVIDDQGRIAERYDKRFCSHTEITDWFSPGFRPATFTVDASASACSPASRSTFRRCSPSTRPWASTACCCPPTRSTRSSR